MKQISFALLSVLTIFLGYYADRTDFIPFILAFLAAFLLYGWLAFGYHNISFRHLLWLGVALRLLLLFSMPQMSDDVFRFLWDGRLTVAGYHPFLHTPRYFIDSHTEIPGITPDLFLRLNSPDYFTVYPPVCQAVFAAAGFVSPVEVLPAVVVIKLFMLIFEGYTVWLLWKNRGKFGLPENAAVMYALNPLVILEFSGNLHFEGAMICFLLAGFIALQKDKIVPGAICWALATATKLLPLMLLPAVWKWLGLQKGARFVLFFGLITAVLFSPLLAVLPNLLESLDLYFRQFQFNASFYYVIRVLGLWLKGWDIGEYSGPALGLLTLAGVIWLALQVRTGDSAPALARTLLFSFFLYLSMAAVVQPWYVAVPMVFSLFTRHRFLILWSGLAALSYSHYNGGQFQEHYWLIALEYVFVWKQLVGEEYRR
jgi:alpha-1,6-mannosyltransferase